MWDPGGRFVRVATRVAVNYDGRHPDGTVELPPEIVAGMVDRVRVRDGEPPVDVHGSPLIFSPVHVLDMVEISKCCPKNPLQPTTPATARRPGWL